MGNNPERKDIDNNFLELRVIINSWNLIPNSPKDEFDSLNHKVLSHLYKNAGYEKIKQIIESELCANFGFFINEFESDKMANAIMNWWNIG